MWDSCLSYLKTDESRSFQIEYEVKQMMLLNPVDLFEKCVFSTKPKSILSEKSEPLGKEVEEVVKEEDVGKEEKVVEEEEKLVEEEEKEKVVEELDIENLEELLLEKNDLDEKNEMDICEIDLEIPMDLEEDVLQLKNRNEVYFEMYREAKRKARLARDFALSAYLEAKRIKNTYLLNEAFDSDDEEEKSLDTMKI